MDTTNYDTKMNELRAAASASGQLSKEALDKVLKPAGRPKGPEKVVYKRNVEPSMIAKIDEFIKGGGVWPPLTKEARILHGQPPAPSPELSALDEVKKQLAMVLEDNDRLSKEVATMENRLQRVARLTDNEKLILWIRKYDELKKVYDLRVGGSEFSQ